MPENGITLFINWNRYNNRRYDHEQSFTKSSEPAGHAPADTATVTDHPFAESLVRDGGA